MIYEVFGLLLRSLFAVCSRWFRHGAGGELGHLERSCS
jgi:hypothetical protein